MFPVLVGSNNRPIPGQSISPELQELMQFAEMDLSTKSMTDYARKLLIPEKGSLDTELQKLGLNDTDIRVLKSLADEHVTQYRNALKTQDLDLIAQADLNLFTKFWSHNFCLQDEEKLTSALLQSLFHKLQTHNSSVVSTVLDSVTRSGNLYISLAKDFLGSLFSQKKISSEYDDGVAQIIKHYSNPAFKSVMAPKLDATNDKTAIMSSQTKSFMALRKYIQAKNLNKDEQLKVFKSYAKESVIAPMKFARDKVISFMTTAFTTPNNLFLQTMNPLAA